MITSFDVRPTFLGSLFRHICHWTELIRIKCDKYQEHVLKNEIVFVKILSVEILQRRDGHSIIHQYTFFINVLLTSLKVSFQNGTKTSQMENDFIHYGLGLRLHKTAANKCISFFYLQTLNKGRSDQWISDQTKSGYDKFDNLVALNSALISSRPFQPQAPAAFHPGLS